MGAIRVFLYAEGFVRKRHCSLCRQVIPPERSKDGISGATDSEALYRHCLYKRDLEFVTKAHLVSVNVNLFVT
jgi:hypothetical protein